MFVCLFDWKFEEGQFEDYTEEEEFVDYIEKKEGEERRSYVMVIIVEKSFQIISNLSSLLYVPIVSQSLIPSVSRLNHSCLL